MVCWISATSTAWELDRNTQSQAPPQTYGIRIRRREPAICVLSSSQRLLMLLLNLRTTALRDSEHPEKHSCYSVTDADLLKRFTVFYSTVAVTLISLSSAFILLHVQWMGLLPVLARACKEDRTLYHLGLWFL